MKAFEELRVKGIDVGFVKSAEYWISEKDLRDYLLKLHEAIDRYDDIKLMRAIFYEDKDITTGQALAVMKFIDFLTKE